MSDGGKPIPILPPNGLELSSVATKANVKPPPLPGLDVISPANASQSLSARSRRPLLSAGQRKGLGKLSWRMGWTGLGLIAAAFVMPWLMKNIVVVIEKDRLRMEAEAVASSMMRDHRDSFPAFRDASRHTFRLKKVEVKPYQFHGRSATQVRPASNGYIPASYPIPRAGWRAGVLFQSDDRKRVMMWMVRKQDQGRWVFDHFETLR